MEAQQTTVSPVATGIRYGLIIAAVATIADFLLRIARLNIWVYWSLGFALAIAIAVIGVVIAHRDFRKANSGLMSYNQGVIIALLAVAIWALLSSLFNYVYVNYIDPDFVDGLKADMTAFLEGQRMPANRIAESTARFEEMRPPLGKAIVSGIGRGVAFGLVFGLIISAFTKRKPADFE